MFDTKNIPKIQWFPGHMAKARRLIEENLKLVDIAVELLDARIPLASTNPLIKSIIGNKFHLIVLNKADLADPKITQNWLDFYHSMGKKAIAVDTVHGKNMKTLTTEIAHLTMPLTHKLAQHNVKPRRARAMILGIPNVGKSSLINKLSHSAAAKAENRPGVTRAKQWIKLKQNIDLLDMPGLLWPKFDDPITGLHLAFTGAINDDIYDREHVTLFLLHFLSEHYPQNLQDRYRIDILPNDIYELFTLIGQKRGHLLKGARIDEEKTYTAILNDFRSGKLGRISFERPSF